MVNWVEAKPYEDITYHKADGMARIAFNRPEVRNAFNDAVIAELTQAFTDLGNSAEVRAIILAAEGVAFCAGADLNWMRRMADYTRAENLADAAQLAEMLRTNDRMTMWRSIEARVPFLDNELIDFGLHLPCRLKYHRGVTKRLVHALALKRLPQDIVRRPKIGFHAPSSLWSGLADFLLGGGLAELLKWRSSDQQAILHMFRKLPRMLYRLLSTELWVRIYLHGESPASLGESMLQLRLKAGS